MQRYLFTLVILMIPAVLALGHDIYLYSQNMEKPFELTDYGYIWTTYSPDTFAQFMSDANSATRDGINVLLKQKAVLVGIGYGIFLFIGMGFTFFILKLMFGSFGGSSYSGKDSVFNRDKGSKFVYKRK